MTEKQQKHLEERLIEERERVRARIARLDESVLNSDQDGDITTYPLHLADEGTDTMEQEKDQMLRSMEGEQLQEIDEALRKLYKEPDAFGKCEKCGDAIAFERLDLVPWARLCANDQAMLEGAAGAR